MKLKKKRFLSLSACCLLGGKGSFLSVKGHVSCEKLDKVDNAVVQRPVSIFHCLFLYQS